MSVEDSELAASNKHLSEFFTGRSWPNIGLGMFLSGFFEKLILFFRRFVLTAGAVQILFGGYL